MNKKLFLVAALSLGMAAAPAVMADPDRDQHDQHGERGHGDRDHRDRGDEDHQDNGWHGERERHWDGDRYSPGAYRAPRGYVRHEWHQGDRIPVTYRSSRYVVNDYRTYHLDPPPRGQQWVRVDNDIVLTAITTGVVAAVVYGIFQ